MVDGGGDGGVDTPGQDFVHRGKLMQRTRFQDRPREARHFQDPLRVDRRRGPQAVPLLGEGAEEGGEAGDGREDGAGRRGPPAGEVVLPEEVGEDAPAGPGADLHSRLSRSEEPLTLDSQHIQ